VIALLVNPDSDATEQYTRAGFALIRQSTVSPALTVLGSVNTNIFSSIGVVEARAQKTALWAVC
jgi:hypothetical protein